MALPLIFDFYENIIEVPSPDTSLNMQYLIDQIRDAEDELVQGLEYNKIAEASGKDSLGGGMLTAITVRLLDNWRVRFEARPGPDIVQCTISGGNLVGGPGGVPVAPSAFTQVLQQSSSSGVIATPTTANDSTNLKFMMATMMAGANKAVGSVFYWDPESGSDSNSGLSPSTAVRTFSQAQSLVSAGANDVIFCIASSGSGITTVTETLNITKNNLKLRGPGYIFQLIPNNQTQDTITISANNVEISGLFVSTSNTGARSGLRISSASNVSVTDCWLSNSRLHGVELNASQRVNLTNCVIEHAGLSGSGNGIEVGNTTQQTSISKCIIFDHGDNGILLSGANIRDNLIQDCLIYNNSGYGINIGSSVVRTTIRGSNTIGNNGTANTLDLGQDTFIETSDTSLSAPAIADAVWDEVISGHLGPNTAGKFLKDAKVKATLASIG